MISPIVYGPHGSGAVVQNARDLLSRGDIRMKIGIRFSVFAFISTLVLSIVAISPPARAVSVSFDQVTWQNGAGGYVDQNSQSGEAVVSFSGGDAGSLAPFGAGFAGYLNIVTSVSGGSNNNWAVDNEPVIFSSPGELANDLPLTLDIDLGQSDGTAVSSLNYSLSLSPTPLLSQPGGSLTSASVSADPIVNGTTTDPNFDGDAEDTGATDTDGAPGGAVPYYQFGTTARIATNNSSVPGVNEAYNGCAPGSAARSIGYLGQMFPSLGVTNSAQAIYASLTNLMMSATGPASTNRGAMAGTSLVNFTNGKSAYFAANGLTISNTAVTTSFPQIIAAINSTQDVEMSFRQGITTITSNGLPGGVLIRTNGSHAVFVSQVIPIFSTNVAMTLLGYQVQCVDSVQGVGTTNARAYNLFFYPNGTLYLGTNTVGAQLNNFRIESAFNTVPEPSSLAMAALGLGALASSIVFRRRKRNRT
jgi:hypothetical protein